MSVVIPTRVKICGLTRAVDVDAALDAGVELLGLNFVPSSPRAVTLERARELVRHIQGRAEVVGVVADLNVQQLAELRSAVGLDSFQLHGSEPPEIFVSLAACDYKAVRIGSPEDVLLARRFPRQRLLVDAKVPGVLGGSGQRFDWSLVRELSIERELLLAGGLTPENVAAAVQAVHPWAVDTASGVESQPGIKDSERVRRFAERARSAES